MVNFKICFLKQSVEPTNAVLLFFHTEQTIIIRNWPSRILGYKTFQELWLAGLMIGDIKEMKTAKTHLLHTLQKRNQ